MKTFITEYIKEERQKLNICPYCNNKPHITRTGTLKVHCKTSKCIMNNIFISIDDWNYKVKKVYAGDNFVFACYGCKDPCKSVRRIPTMMNICGKAKWKKCKIEIVED